MVLLACADGDYGLCRASDAARNAQDLADSERLTITTRDAITDAVIGTYEPTLPPDAAFEAEIVAEDNKGPVALSDTCVISFCVANTNAMAIGQLLANKYGVAVRLNDMLTNASLTELSPVVKGTKAPKPAKAEKLAKAPKAPKEPKVAGEKKAREPRAAKLAPSGMRLQIIEACCRKSGATPAYLNDLTKWKKAPWKWLMSNPKGTGLCDRYGYTLTVGRNVDDKGAVYKMTKNAA